MKSGKLFGVVYLFLAANASAQEKPYRPATSNRNPDHYNPLPSPGITEEEDADPPPGGFKKYLLRSIKMSRDIVVRMIGELPQAEKDAPEFAKVEALRAALDQVLLTASKADLFALIDRSVELKRLPSTGPKFGRVCNALSIIGGDVKRVVAKHLEESNGVVSNPELETFVRLHSWILEGDSEWEEAPPPIDSPGIMILNAPAVVAYLKTLPWQEADGFLLQGWTAAEAFERYGANGTGMPILKTKFAANQAVIIAKWDELAAWVAEQQESEEE